MPHNVPNERLAELIERIDLYTVAGQEASKATFSEFDVWEIGQALKAEVRSREYLDGLPIVRAHTQVRVLKALAATVRVIEHGLNAHNALGRAKAALKAAGWSQT